MDLAGAVKVTSHGDFITANAEHLAIGMSQVCRADTIVTFEREPGGIRFRTPHVAGEVENKSATFTLCHLPLEVVYTAPRLLISLDLN